MKAVVFHDVGDIRLETIADPKIQDPFDAIVRTTASAICGTDLHMVRGTMTGMKEGTVLGHEAVGVVEEVGKGIRNLKAGDRVVIPSTIACGYCSYCRAGYHAQCDNANPNGSQAGTAFFGGPEMSGPFDGLQAEYARIPWANTGLVKLPDEVSDDDAILISDIFPTGYFGADMAEIRPGDTVAVFGCGPVGQFAILSAKLKRAGRVFAIDAVPSRLEMAAAQGAEVINFEEEHPVEVLRELTGGIGPDRAIDAVGVDAECAHHGPAADDAEEMKKQFQQEVNQVAPNAADGNGRFVPGDAPSQALRWAVESLAKAGTLSIIGVYPPSDFTFPIGMAMMRNLAVNMGNCHHRRYIPRLVELCSSGKARPTGILTQQQPLSSAIEAYETFDDRQAGSDKNSGNIENDRDSRNAKRKSLQVSGELEILKVDNQGDPSEVQLTIQSVNATDTTSTSRDSKSGSSSERLKKGTVIIAKAGEKKPEFTLKKDDSKLTGDTAKALSVILPICDAKKMHQGFSDAFAGKESRKPGESWDVAKKDVPKSHQNMGLAYTRATYVGKTTLHGIECTVVKFQCSAQPLKVGTKDRQNDSKNDETANEDKSTGKNLKAVGAAAYVYLPIKKELPPLRVGGTIAFLVKKQPGKSTTQRSNDDDENDPDFLASKPGTIVQYSFSRELKPQNGAAVSNSSRRDRSRR
eukprot:g5289.t1